MENKGFISAYPGLKYAKDNVSILVVLDGRRAKNNGLFPVKVQVVFKREQKFYPTGKDLSVKDWNELSETKSKILISVRNDIKNTFEKIEAVIKTLVNEDKFSFETLNMRLGKCTTDTINTAFAAKIEALKNDGAIGNMLNYQSAMRSMEAFAGNKIAFSDVTADWLKRYEKHLLSEDKSYVTVSMYIRCIRAIINDAKRAGVIKEAQYPFGRDKYEIPEGEGRKLALPMQQIKSVVNYTDGRETTERYRDLWFFSYLCNGVNFGDMLQLRYRDIENGEICWYRAKTMRTTKNKKKICATITVEMQAIIDKWGNPDKKPDTIIFQYLTGNEDPIKKKMIIHDVIKRTNKRLKAIGKAVGIEGLTTYAARHSYATVLKRSGANIAFISESLGHSDLKTTENYLASFEKEERKKNAALLTKFE
jgi:integrase